MVRLEFIREPATRSVPDAGTAGQWAGSPKGMVSASFDQLGAFRELRLARSTNRASRARHPTTGSHSNAHRSAVVLRVLHVEPVRRSARTPLTTAVPPRRTVAVPESAAAEFTHCSIRSFSLQNWSRTLHVMRALRCGARTSLGHGQQDHRPPPSTAGQAASFPSLYLSYPVGLSQHGGA